MQLRETFELVYLSYAVNKMDWANRKFFFMEAKGWKGTKEAAKVIQQN